MERRLLVGWLTALLVVAWGTFALSYASSPPTEGLLGLSVIIGVTLTCVAAYLIALAWTQGKRLLRSRSPSLRLWSCSFSRCFPKGTTSRTRLGQCSGYDP